MRELRKRVKEWRDAAQCEKLRRMNPAAVLFGIALLFTGVGLAYKLFSSPPFISPTDRIWVLGDSLGVGLLPRLQRDFANVVSGDPVVGTTIQAWEANPAAVQAAKAFGATVALVVLGTNDSAAIESYRAGISNHVHALMAELQLAGMRVVWVGPGAVPNFPAQSRQVQVAVSATAGPMGARVLDPTWLPISKPDGIHPDPAGYEEMAGWIVDMTTR